MYFLLLVLQIKGMDSESLSLVDFGSLVRVRKSCCPFLAEKLLQIKRNKILILCLMALSLDPLFCYITVIDDGKNCLKLDRTLGIIAVVMRSIVDFFYILHIMFQFRATRSVNPLDILAILPLPQVLVFAVVPKLNNLRVLKAAKLLNFVFIFHYVLRLLQICSLLKKDLRETGILAKSTFANLLFFMLASHVLGAFWFLFSVKRKATCWLEACKHVGDHCSLYCAATYRADTILKDYCSKNSTVFDFGIYGDALSSGVVDSADIVQRISYCVWWGLQNLSSLGQSLKTSTNVWEIYFSIFVSISGLLSFAFLIGNVQAFLLSEVAKAEKMRVRAEQMRSLRQDLESWTLFHYLSEDLKEKILETMEKKLHNNILIDGYNFFDHLPMDLRKDTIRQLGSELLRRVPLFAEWDTAGTQLLDATSDSLKPAFYTEESYISQEQETVAAMIFVARGRLFRQEPYGVKTESFWWYSNLEQGDFFGEEIIRWAIDPQSSSNIPLSIATVKSISKVLVFILKAEDLKIVVSQYLQLRDNDDIHHIRNKYRLYSMEWRTWAACFIQAAWRSYYKKKLEKALREEYKRLQDEPENAATSSSISLGATIYASRFATNALRPVRFIGKHRATMTERNLPKLIKKPEDFI